MSIWGKIAGIAGIAAAPFTGGTSLAWVPTALGVGSAVDSAFGSGGGGTSNKDDLSVLSKDFSTRGRATAVKGENAVDPSIAYLTKLLSGDRDSIAEATAPTNATILGQYDTARRSVASMAPRGGAKGEKIAESYFQEASDMTRSVETARSGAATQLASLGLDLSKLGISEEELASSGLSEILKSMTAERGQNLETFTSLGSGIGKILSSILLKKKGDSPSSGSGSGGGPNDWQSAMPEADNG